MTLFTRLKKRLTSTSIFSVDPSIQNTGYAVLSCSDSIQISEIGLLFSDDQLSDDSRIWGITSRICHLAAKYPNPRVVIEKPAIVYGKEKLNKQALVARASSLFKLFTLYGSLTTALKLKSIPFSTFLPIEWQRLVKQPKQDVKKLSLAIANDRLRNQRVLYLGRERHNICLKTKLHANMADAINIGYHYWLYCHA